MESTKGTPFSGEKAPWAVKFRSYKKASRASALHKLALQAKAERMDKLRVW